MAKKEKPKTPAVTDAPIEIPAPVAPKAEAVRRFKLQRESGGDIDVVLNGLKLVSFHLNKNCPMPQPAMILDCRMRETFQRARIHVYYDTVYTDWLLVESLQQMVDKKQIIIDTERDA